MLRAEVTESLTSLLIFVRTQTTFICVSLQPNSIHQKRGRQNYLICCFVWDSYIWLMVNTQWNKEWHDLCQVEKIVHLTGLNLAVAWFCGAHHSRERLLFHEKKEKTQPDWRDNSLKVIWAVTLQATTWGATVHLWNVRSVWCDIYPCYK